MCTGTGAAAAAAVTSEKGSGRLLKKKLVGRGICAPLNKTMAVSFQSFPVNYLLSFSRATDTAWPEILTVNLVQM